MAEAQNHPHIEPDAGLLAAARARTDFQYAKQAIARARLSIGHPSIPNAFSVFFPPGHRNSIIPPLPPLTDFQGRLMHEDVNMQDVPREDSTNAVAELCQNDETLEKEEADKFEAVKRWFDGLKKPSLADQVRYTTAKRDQDIRSKRSESRKQLQEQEINEQEEDENSDDGLFVPENDGGDTGTLGASSTARNNRSPVPAPAKPPRKRKAQNRISAEERRRSMRAGFEPIREKMHRNNKRAGAAKSKDAGTKGVKPKQDKRRGKKKNDDQPTAPITFNSNVIEEVHANSALPAPPSFTSSRRNGAIAQLVARIPSADQEELKDDAARLKEALRKFNGTVRTDSEGGWKLKGLKTRMYHYQVLGCAWMRDRENSPEEPRGGLLADTMGFGKTLQALVNIIDGLPSDPDDPVRTTLLIVPSHLVKHWMDQMRMHCDESYIGEAVEYHAHAKLSTLDVVKTLSKFQIVVTTYDEIRRSYPVFKPPKELADEKKLYESWEKTYEEKLGPLHRIKYLRIVLDEAHMIKNKDSSISTAVRGLTARYKWLLSGTPIQNWKEELYPLYDFLGVPQTKSYSQFISYYCSDDEGQQRLCNLNRTYMYRRTHASRMFSVPIIKLPDIRETRIDVQFSEAEWIFYEAIEKMFLDAINGQAGAPDFRISQCRSGLTMITKLRMFCSHLLTVQDFIMYNMCLGPVMKSLNKLSKPAQDGSSNNSDSSAVIVSRLRAVKSNYKELVKKREPEEQDQTAEPPIFNDNPELINRYYKFMEALHSDGNWVERCDRGICPGCSGLSEKGVITSCMHLYCEECFSKLQIEAEEPGSKTGPEMAKPVCSKCTTPIEEATRCRATGESGPDKPPASIAAARKQRNQLRTSGRNKVKRKNSSEDEDGDIDEEDWIKTLHRNMIPSAKLTGITEKIKEWKRQNGAVKVVIFSQFLDFIRILGEMCKLEGWKHRFFTGKLRVAARHKNLDEFRTDPEITILIVSLQTGGTGLDMTVAHKCILVDLWWNEAVQNQAFCRLLRHGQTHNVECVKMVVEDTIDAYMLELQSRKTEDISSTMGEDVMSKRDTVIDLLKMFAHVSEDEAGRLRLTPVEGKYRKGRLKAMVTSSKDTNNTE
ncbi:putative SNF2 family helicase [Aspergillus lucknowensis]|uniref:SNF2 family N-terminal domain-containing protein n=1 Tax=Aspergillus lucknowensis TaxID=176173 RepID=A0ABR4L9N5_9EURO